MNYKEIVDASIAYADRQDIEVDRNVDTFLLMVESRINRLLKVRKQTARAFAPTVDGQEYYCLPADYAGMRDIQLNSTIPLTAHSVSQYHYLSPEQMNVKRNEGGSGTNYYTVIADKIQVLPCPPAGMSIEMIYYRRLPTIIPQEIDDVLETPDKENWLSIDHPDIYISGMTGQIEKFAKNHEIAGQWFQEMSALVSELDYADDLERWAGQALVTRAG
jgi:hypothetical protein